MLITVMAVWFMVSMALLLGLALAARKSSAGMPTDDVVYFAKEKRMEVPILHPDAAHHHLT